MKTAIFAIVCNPLRGGGKSHWRLALVAVLLCCTPGCLIIPTPEHDSGQARANISKKTPACFRTSQSTRAEVVLALGEPDAVSPDECKLIYRSEKICGFWVVYGGSGGDFMRDRYLVAEFDPQGVLLGLEQSATSLGSSPAAAFCGMANQTNATAFPWASPETIVRLQKPVRWLAGVDGYKSRGAVYQLGEPGLLLLTDTELHFIDSSKFANAGPALTLPYATITGVSVDQHIFGRRMVVRCGGDKVESFEVLGPKAMATDKEALLAVVEFLQARSCPQTPLMAR
jgi:hypothetical protein